MVCCSVRDGGGSAHRLLEDGTQGIGGFTEDNDGPGGDCLMEYGGRAAG